MVLIEVGDRNTFTNSVNFIIVYYRFFYFLKLLINSIYPI